jgi:DNA-binding transcriptional MerR regulator
LVKEKGMTLEGAKKQLQLRSKPGSKEELLAKLEGVKASLIQLKEKM